MTEIDVILLVFVCLATPIGIWVAGQILLDLRGSPKKRLTADRRDDIPVVKRRKYTKLTVIKGGKDDKV
jgi:hypothetical protein